MANDKQHTHELIDDYLNGILKGKALEIFEKRMQVDQSFAREVRLHKLIIEGIQEAENEKLLDVLKQADSEMEEPVVKKISFLKFYRIAALVILLLAVAAYFLFFNENKTDRIFTKYFSPYKNDLISYSRSSEVPQEFYGFSLETYNQAVVGMKAYEKGDYKIAANLFTEAISSGPEKPELIFYLSIAQLENDEVYKAINNLRYLLLLRDFRYHSEAKWYLALALIKAEETATALEILQTIPDNSKYTKKVEQIEKFLSD